MFIADKRETTNVDPPSKLSGDGSIGARRRIPPHCQCQVQSFARVSARTVSQVVKIHPVVLTLRGQPVSQNRPTVRIYRYYFRKLASRFYLFFFFFTTRRERAETSDNNSPAISLGSICTLAVSTFPRSCPDSPNDKLRISTQSSCKFLRNLKQTRGDWK